jgi:Domain of unknown function (DUF3786)
MCHALHERFFLELNKMDAKKVADRALCEYDENQNCYTIIAWNETYKVYPATSRIICISQGNKPVDIEFGLAILFYLLKGTDDPIKDEWISEKDLPGGVSFFVGPHKVPVHLFAEKYGEDLPGFRAVCEKLGGQPIEMGDAAYSFKVLPRIPLAVILWAKDNEFDAEAKLLFDKTIQNHLPIDVIFGLSVEVCQRIARD